MHEFWLEETAQAFWRRCSIVPKYPIDIMQVILWTVPLGIVELKGLRVRAVENWFAKRGIPFASRCADRSLFGCLVAYGGKGIVFLDESAEEGDRRFTLAHEAAHFILDYEALRKRANARLGPSVMDVLDGRRLATRDERIDAMLTGVSVGTFTSFLGRGPQGEMDYHILHAENKADMLAYELLAPEARVRARLRKESFQLSTSALRSTLIEILITEFGLGRGPAEGYAARLLRASRTRRSLTEWLGVASES